MIFSMLTTPTIEKSAQTIYKTSLIAFLLFVLVVASYLPALRAGFIWDDDDYVTNNVALRSLDGLKRIWLEIGATDQYYPLVFTTFWLEHQLWGNRPFGYHLNNLLLHIAAAFMFFLILRRLQIPCAWFAAALFAIHPIQVESVAWITERKNVLSSFFFMLAFYTYIPLTNNDKIKFSYQKYFWAFGFYICALLSKTVAVSLPFVILVLVWRKKERISLNDLLRLIPFIIAGAAAGLITVWVETHHVGAAGMPWRLSLLERILLAGRAWWFYIAKTIFPHNLTFIYPRWTISARSPAQYIYPLSALAVFLILWIARRQKGRGALAALACYTIALFPALGFFSIYPMRYSYVADHFQYHAAPFLLTLIAAGLALRIPAKIRNSLFAILLLILACLTFRQTLIYKDAETLWRDTIAKNPNAGIAHNNLANILSRRGQNEESLSHYSKAIEDMPYDEVLYYNKANALLTLGRLPEAGELYAASLKINPRFAEAHNNLGNALLGQGRLAEAERHFKEALVIKPRMENPHAKLGDIMFQQGRAADAAAHYRAALDINPDLPETSNNLAWILATTNEMELKNPEEALQWAQKAYKKTGGRDASSLDTLAAAYAALGRFDEAIAHAQQALQLAHEKGERKTADEISARLALYKSRQPFTERKK